MSDKKLVLAVNFVGVDKMSATTRALYGATKTATDQIKSMKVAVKDLNRGLSDAKALRAASAALKKHKDATKDAAEKLALLKGQVISGEAPTQKLVRSIQSAEKSLFKLQAAEKKSADTARVMVQSMRDAGVDVTRLGAFEQASAQKIEIANRALERQERILKGNKKAMADVIAMEKRAGRDQPSGGAGLAHGKNSPAGQPSGNARSAPPIAGSPRTGGDLLGTIYLAKDAISASVETGANFEALMLRLRALGLSAKAVDDLVAYANGMDVAGSSRVDNLRYLLEAQGTFRETGDHTLEEQVKGAKIMAPMMARLMATSKALGQELSADQESYFLRFVDQAGGLSSPSRAAELTNGLFKALISSGGNVNPMNYQTFLSQAGSAGQMLSSRSMFSDLEPIIMEMHEKAGTALNTTYKRIVGGALKSASASELVRLGIWDKNAVEFNSLGGVKRLRNGKNPLGEQGLNLLSTDPVEFYRQIVLPSYAKAGIGLGDSSKERQRRISENMMLFGGTGSNLFNLIDKQLPTILKSRSAYDKTMNLTDAHNLAMSGVLGAQEKWQSSVEDMKLGFSQGIIGLGAFTSALNGVTAFMRKFVPSGSIPGASSGSFSPPVAPMKWGGGFMAPLTPIAPARTGPSAWQNPTMGGPIAVHVHAAPGQSEDAIAASVMRKIEQKQGITARSSYNGGR
jgi:hypothetical protein